MKKDRILCQHILEAIEKIERYVRGMSQQQFAHDEKTIDAVVRELTIIGEAAANLSDSFRDKHARIPFHEVIGMRNRIIHEYWAVDIDVIWKTCTEDIVTLKDAMTSALP